MNAQVSYSVAAVASILIVGGASRFDQTVHASRGEHEKPATPIVFRAAGPTVASIQSMVDAFRAAIGGVNNANTPGPLPDGRREINWDGGGSTATSPVATPFDGFLVTRGGRFTTRGSGFVQAPVDGLATFFNNPTYATIFQAFSPTRLFSPVDSNVTNARFFIPGGGELPATTAGFGAVFSDVDQASGDDDRSGYDKKSRRQDNPGSSMSFYGIHGDLLFTVDVPASKGDASLSFVGVQFDAAKIAYVRIRTGNAAPGPNDTSRRDVVMMDDFLYAEPQAIDAQTYQDNQMLQQVEQLDTN